MSVSSMSVTVTLDEPLVRWALSLKGITPEQAILELLHEHAGVVSQLEQALELFKQSLLKFPVGIEFEVPQVIGSVTWNTYERATRLNLGKRIRKEAEVLGLEFMHKTASNHAVYRRKSNSIREILVDVARNRSLITYGALVNLLGLPPMDGAWAAHPLSAIFETLDQEDAIAQRPFRTTVVVKSNDSTPGGGYYEALERLKGIQARNALRKLEVFTRELQALYALYTQEVT